MKHGNMAEKLNNIADSELKKENSLKGTVTFSQGETLFSLKEVCKKLAPCGKVVAVYTERTFLNYGSKFTSVIGDTESKPVNMVLQKKDVADKNTVRELTEVLDDARIVVTFDAELIGLAFYVASVKEIPAVFFMKEFSDYKILPTEFGLNSENFQGYKILGAERYINLDVEEIEKAGKEYLPYISVVKHIPSFADYRIACENNVALANQSAYNLAKSAVLETYEIYKRSQKERFETLMVNYFKLGIANLVTGGELLEGSAVGCAEKLAEVGGFSSCPFEVSRIITGLYALGFTGEYDNAGDCVDDLKRVGELVNVSGASEGLFLSSMKEQTLSFKITEKKDVDVYARLKDELISQSKLYPKIKSTYLSLGGSVRYDKEKTVYVVKHSGDLPNTFNGMTYLREKGLLESL